MKKKLMVGALSLALMFGLGTTAYYVYAHGNDSNFGSFMMNQGVNTEEMERFMEEQGVDVDQMYDVMNTGNWDDMQEFMNNNNIDFDEMLPYMQKVHPTLDKGDLEDMYNDCHGSGSATNSSFRGMMN